jgi:hypothetical protein
VEVDETYIGGKARFMHKSKRERVLKGNTGWMGKTAVMSLLDRHGKDRHSTMRTQIVTNTRKNILQPIVNEHVEVGSAVYTDAHESYKGLSSNYVP